MAASLGTAPKGLGSTGNTITSPDTAGRIKLFLAKKTELELKEWITTDAQGLDTRVELTEISKAQDLDPAMFKPANQIFQKND